MTEDDMISRIYHFVKEKATYVPRDYKTMGGAWTVDTWKLAEPEITIQLMDEGYTQVIRCNGLDVHSTYGQPAGYREGNSETLGHLYKELIGDGATPANS